MKSDGRGRENYGEVKYGVAPVNSSMETDQARGSKGKASEETEFIFIHAVSLQHG